MRSFLAYLLLVVGLFAVASAQEQQQHIHDDLKLDLQERLSHLSRQTLLRQEDAELVKLQLKKALEESGIDERAHVKKQGAEQEDAENRRKERRRRANDAKPLDVEKIQKEITRKLHLLKYRGQ